MRGLDSKMIFWCEQQHTSQRTWIYQYRGVLPKLWIEVETWTSGRTHIQQSAHPIIQNIRTMNSNTFEVISNVTSSSHEWRVTLIKHLTNARQSSNHNTSHVSVARRGWLTGILVIYWYIIQYDTNTTTRDNPLTKSWRHTSRIANYTSTVVTCTVYRINVLNQYEYQIFHNTTYSQQQDTHNPEI